MLRSSSSDDLMPFPAFLSPTHSGTSHHEQYKYELSYHTRSENPENRAHFRPCDAGNSPSTQSLFSFLPTIFSSDFPKKIDLYIEFFYPSREHVHNMSDPHSSIRPAMSFRGATGSIKLINIYLQPTPSSILSLRSGTFD